MSGKPVQYSEDDIVRREIVPLGTLQTFMEEVELIRGTHTCKEYQVQISYVNLRYDFNLEEVELPSPYEIKCDSGTATISWPPSDKFLRGTKALIKDPEEGDKDADHDNTG